MSDMIQQYHNRIISEINLGNYDSAISNCRKILRTNETDWRAKFYLGYCRACKKQSTDSTEDITEMNRHIDRTLKDVSRISFIEQEMAYREIAKQLVDYATNSENEIQKVHEKNNGEYAPIQLRKRAHRVYGMLLSMEKLLEDHVNATSAASILSEAAKEFKTTYPLLSDIDESNEIEKVADKKAITPRNRSSCLLTAILFVILFLATVFMLKSLYNYLYMHQIAQGSQTLEKEEETKEDGDLEEDDESDEPEVPVVSVAPGDKLPVYYYEVEAPVTSGNTSYEEGSPFEKLVDDCHDTDLNPTLKVFDELVKSRIFIKTCSIKTSQMEDIGMQVQFTDGSQESETAEFYDFSEPGSKALLKDILNHMCNSSMFKPYSVKAVYEGVLENMPEFTYSPEKIPCYYTFVQIRFKGMAYLWQIYTCSEDGYNISKISAEMMGIRYIKGGGAGSSLHMQKLDLQMFANQMLFMEAAEHTLAGKHEIQNWLDVTQPKVSDTFHEFSNEYGNWTESARFYESGDVGTSNEEWQDSHMLKAELSLERH